MGKRARIWNAGGRGAHGALRGTWEAFRRCFASWKPVRRKQMRRILMPIVVAMAAGYAAHAQDVAPKPDADASRTVATQPQLAEALVGLPIYSSDAQKVGQVTSIDVSADGTINTVQAEIEGFLGLGSRSVRITSD